MSRQRFFFSAVLILLACLCAVPGCQQKPTQTPVADETDVETGDAGGTSSQSDTQSGTQSGGDVASAAVRQALVRGDLAKAEALCRDALMVDPDNVAMLEMAADLALNSGRAAEAAELYDQTLQKSDQPSEALIQKAGSQWMALGQPYRTIKVLRKAVTVHPSNAHFRQILIGTLNSVGLEREAFEHLKWLVQHNQGSAPYLTVLADLNRPQTNVKLCQAALQQNLDDLRPAFGLARNDAYQSNWQAVVDRLEPVVKQHSDFVPAYALQVRALVELNATEALQELLKNPPKGIEQNPQYWIAAGTWAMRKDDPGAAYALARAVALDENNGESLALLAQALLLIDQPDNSKVVNQRAADLLAMRDTTDKYFAWRKNSQETVVQLSKDLAKLGRNWEAMAWLQAATQMRQHPDPTLPQVFRQIRADMTDDSPWQEPAKLVSTKIDISKLPVFAWETSKGEVSEASGSLDPANIRFADRAADLGLDHVFRVNKPDGKESGLAIHQTGAGGVGVIDYDLDGSPDLYLSTSDGQPLKDDSGLNQLFRNLQSKFANVTEDSKASDTGFAQGIAVADFNSDGFPDLMVANIGANHLYRNNGDGTFEDVSEQAGLADVEWTTSLAIADIDGDGHADLFQVGYCAGQTVFDQPCVEPTIKEPRACVPVAFDALRDRVYRGRGDGGFADVSEQWLPQHPLGYGLGTVVGSLDDQPGLDVYVANDTKGNHFWSRSPGDGPFSLVESATIRGLAFNARSIAQASMGVAAGDADQDGDVDFFVTHFTNDYHTFYKQVRPGMWADRTTPTGFAKPTRAMLGFGTQWIDADNDGNTELLVGNGHIDDFTHNGDSFRMPTQMFQRQADGSWAELSRETLGDCFQVGRLSRGVATLDANRDGKMDAVIASLYDPVAMLINESQTPAKSIKLYLRAVGSHRDAIGAKASYQVAGKKRSATLLAGDGYQCSNERCITLGVGEAQQVSEVVVTWPDGKQTHYGQLDAGGSYLLVEGLQAAFGF